MLNIDKLSKLVATAIVLERPLIFFDLETTGVNVKRDRIVEIFLHKIHPDGTYETYYSLVNPTVNIPEEASKTHKIYAADVLGANTFHDIAQEVVDFLEGADVAGYNSNKFDIPLIMEELSRSGIVLDHTERKSVDVRNIFVRQEGRSLSDAYKFYTDEDLENAHAAETDVFATEMILIKQLARYQDLPNTVSGLDHYCNYDQDVLDYNGKFASNPDGYTYYTFGRHKGERCIDNKKYLVWIVTESDFSMDVKNVAKAILDGKIK